MTLTLYNTLTRRKEPFKPIDPANVRMYVCGPTVYDLAHIGNARPIIVFDVLFRLLRHIYGEKHVTYARNITDVDDKINARAVERYPDMPPVDAIRRLTEETTAQFHKDIAALGVLPPTEEPRATEYIRRSDDRLDMVRLIDQLVARGHAYVAEEHVLFDVSSMPDYGTLARRSLDEMEAGARVDVAPYKRGAMDFVLWKPSKPGEPSWPSPAGIATPGRPGWHIECSAMAGAILGDVFDIHGGGIDLVFPHHENEVAQSRCAHGTPVMANVWMHNGFLQVEGEKMSKSLGNFVTINELLEGWQSVSWPGGSIKLALLMTQYRQPLDFTRERLEDSLFKLADWFAIVGSAQSGYKRSAPDELIELLSDDLNTPAAYAFLSDLERQARKGNESAAADLWHSLNFLGIDIYSKVVSLLASRGRKDRRIAIASGNDEINRIAKLTQLPPIEQRRRIEDLIAARLAARKAKDWKESDRIRDELAAMGIQLKDGKDPATGEAITTWEVKR